MTEIGRRNVYLILIRFDKNQFIFFWYELKMNILIRLTKSALFVFSLLIQYLTIINLLNKFLNLMRVDKDLSVIIHIN